MAGAVEEMALEQLAVGLNGGHQFLLHRNSGYRPFRQYSPRGICERLQSWNFVPLDTEGYRTAEVTVGGPGGARLTGLP